MHTNPSPVSPPPLPGRRFLTAEWRNLLMINYPIDPALLEPWRPSGTELDFYRGRTFVSMVGFQFLNTRVLGWPIPGHRNFDEINLRFYVRRQVAGEIRRGVVFISEIVPRRAIAWVARWLYNEKYIRYPMRSQVLLPTTEQPGQVEYTWKARGRTHGLAARFTGDPARPDPASEEAFIAEHYWGYSAQPDGTTVEYQVEHPPWELWPATDVRFDCDVEQQYGPAFVAPLHQPPSSAFVAVGSEVAVYRGQRGSG